MTDFSDIPYFHDKMIMHRVNSVHYQRWPTSGCLHGYNKFIGSAVEYLYLPNMHFNSHSKWLIQLVLKYHKK